jgi:hypothetical protein
MGDAARSYNSWQFVREFGRVEFTIGSRISARACARRRNARPSFSRSLRGYGSKVDRPGGCKRHDTADDLVVSDDIIVLFVASAGTRRSAMGRIGSGDHVAKATP